MSFESTAEGRVGIDGADRFHIWECWDPLPWDEACLTSRNMHLRHTCYHAEIGISRSNSTIRWNRRKMGCSRPAYQGHSTSTDTERLATYDFLLVANSNRAPISYRFRDKWRFLSKITIFHIPYI